MCAVKLTCFLMLFRVRSYFLIQLLYYNHVLLLPVLQALEIEELWPFQAHRRTLKSEKKPATNGIRNAIHEGLT